MADARFPLPIEEEKDTITNSSNTSSVVNLSVFSKSSLKPLKTLCINVLLSQGHLNKEDIIPQLPPQLRDEYVQKLLLNAILQGDPIVVQQISEKYPFLLSKKLEEKDFITTCSGQKSAGKTPYQIADCFAPMTRFLDSDHRGKI